MIPTFHAPTARVCIQKALHVAMRRPPTLPEIESVRAMVVDVHWSETPLGAQDPEAQERLNYRRMTALRAMEMLLAKAGDSTLLSNDGLRKITSQAWTIAGAMEAEENVAASLDSVKVSPT